MQWTWAVKGKKKKKSSKDAIFLARGLGKKPLRAGGPAVVFFSLLLSLSWTAPVRELYYHCWHIDILNPKRKPVLLARGTEKKNGLYYAPKNAGWILIIIFFFCLPHNLTPKLALVTWTCMIAQGTRTERNLSFWPEELGERILRASEYGRNPREERAIAGYLLFLRPSQVLSSSLSCTCVEQAQRSIATVLRTKLH